MIYNPLDKFYKSQIGAVMAHNETTFRVKGDFDSVVFVLRKDGEDAPVYFPMCKENCCFQVELKLDCGLFFYYFIADNQYISKGKGLIGELSNNICEYQLTVYSRDYTVPKWIYGGIIYQIFPDRFYSANKNKHVYGGKVLHDNWNETPVFLPNEQGEILNNDFFGGDLKGIVEKLDYLYDLGVTAIYLNPIFEAHSNHRYDTGDYMKIDSLLGDENDLVSLIKKAKEYGIKIILDGVFNHTGADSIYFNKYGNYNSIGAYQDKNSPYYNWYNFINFPDKYESWWGIKTLPSINEDNSDYVDFITGENGVLSKYTKLGIAGWRLDVVDELPSDFVKKIRQRVRKIDTDNLIIGEVWEDVSNKISYGIRREYLQGNELDSAMNYPLKEAIINFLITKDSAKLLDIVKQQIDHYPKLALDAMMNILSTHDTMRLITVLGGKDSNTMTKREMAEYRIPEDKIFDAIFNVKVASLLQFTLCGVPSIYYGDEIGMQGYLDPLNRVPFTWDNKNIDLLNWYKFLCKLRADFSAFKRGDFSEVYCKKGVFCFKRVDEKCEVFIGINIGNDDCNLSFRGKLFDLVSGASVSNQYTLYKNSFCVLVKK